MGFAINPICIDFTDGPVTRRIDNLKPIAPAAEVYLAVGRPAPGKKGFRVRRPQQLSGVLQPAQDRLQGL
jgi:hypothetical protein